MAGYYNSGEFYILSNNYLLMKYHKLLIILLFIQCAAVSGYCQEISLNEGSFKILLDEKNISLKFTYDSLQVGKYKNESDYIAKKVAEINKKNPGKGDAWAMNWKDQRKKLFEPAFSKAFIGSSGKDTASNADYTLIFNTSFIEQGFSSSGILVHKDPEVRGELILIKSDNPSTIIAKAKLTKAFGKAGLNFETGEHIDAAYAEAGEGAGAFILNN
jgi:hypothetical protein